MPRVRSPFVAVLADLKRAFAALRLDWYVFGAQAALVHGATRVTADVDVTVRLGRVEPVRLAKTLSERGFTLRVHEPSFVRTTRVLPIVHVATSVPIDVVLAGPGLEEAFLERAEMRDLGGARVPVARAEDLIAMKILAGRDKDLEDVLAIVHARGADLDRARVVDTLSTIEEALGQSDLLPSWRRIVERNSRPAPAQARRSKTASIRRKRTPAPRRKR